MKKESTIDFLKREAPEMLEKIERILGDETNLRIVKFLYKEQKGLPCLAVVGIEKNGKRDVRAYQPTPIDIEKLKLPYLSEKLKINEGELKKRLTELSGSALVDRFMAKNGDYYSLTSTATGYVKEVYCHILS